MKNSHTITDLLPMTMLTTCEDILNKRPDPLPLILSFMAHQNDQNLDLEIYAV